jgi:hypothetical protein
VTSGREHHAEPKILNAGDFVARSNKTYTLSPFSFLQTQRQFTRPPCSRLELTRLVEYEYALKMDLGGAGLFGRLAETDGHSATHNGKPDGTGVRPGQSTSSRLAAELNSLFFNELRTLWLNEKRAKLLF